MAAVTPHPKIPRSPRVLILIDFINPLDFPGGEKLARPALRAARATARLRERLDARGVAVIYANDNYGVWQSDFHSLVSRCLGRDDESGEIARLLAPRATDLTILKPRHSAFYGSPLELLLKQMEARELILCGLAADMCVQLTAADAFLRGFQVWAPSDCTAAETPPAKAAALKYMAQVLKCAVHSSARAKV
jgi:nicotinamidase-related amidase